MFKVIFLQFFENTHLHPLLLKNLTSVWFFFLCMTSALFICLEFYHSLCILKFHYSMSKDGFFFLNPLLVLSQHFQFEVFKNFNSSCICLQIFFSAPFFFSFSALLFWVLALLCSSFIFPNLSIIVPFPILLTFGSFPQSGLQIH